MIQMLRFSGDLFIGNFRGDFIQLTIAVPEILEKENEVIS